MTPAIESIRKNGDLLERHMFADEEFAQCFPSYPEVWVNYILPNRDQTHSGFAIDAWQALGEAHYSAIVRCWNSWRSFHHIQHLCLKFLDESVNKAAILLDLQGELLAFFGSIGAFSDNMERAFGFIARGGIQTFKSRYANEQEGTLNWFYARRTQQVHMIVVPLFSDKGMVHFDGELYKGKSSVWKHAKGNDLKDVSSSTEQFWKQFVDETRGYWSDLLRLLKTEFSVSETVIPDIPDQISMHISIPSEGEVISGIPYVLPSGVKPPEQYGISGYDPKKVEK